MAEVTDDNQEDGKTVGWFKRADKIIGSSILGLVFLVAVFYATTNSTLSNHTTQIKELGNKMSEISSAVENIKIEPVRSSEEIKALKDVVVDIKEHQQKTDDRLDKIYDLLIDMNNKRNK